MFRIRHPRHRFTPFHTACWVSAGGAATLLCACSDCEWDGVAEQWFDSVEAYKAAYSADPSPTRADTLAHTSRFARMVVTEQAYACEKRVEP